MHIPIYQVDAFTLGPFSGNPAAVCPLDAWLDDATLQNIAAEKVLFRWCQGVADIGRATAVEFACSDEEMHAICHGNAERVFHIAAE